MPATPEFFLASIPGSRISPQAGLYSYARKRMIPLDWLLVNDLEEPVLAASRQPLQAVALFPEYPKLEWILDLSAKPAVLHTRRGVVPLGKLRPPPRKTRSRNLQVVLALACALGIGLLLLAIL